MGAEDIFSYVCMFILGTFILAVVGFLVWVIFSRFRAAKFNFLRTELKFDKEYFEKRKRYGIDSKGIYFPFQYASTEKFKDLSFVKDASVTWDWYSKVNDYDVIFVPALRCSLLSSFIYEMFDDLKDSNSQLHKKLFEAKPIKTHCVKLEAGDELETIGKNILEEIPKANLLTLEETYRIAALINEVAVNGIARNQENFKKFIELGKKEYGIENPEEKIKMGIFPVEKFEMIKIYLEGLGAEFNIKITAYDSRMKASLFEHENFTVGAEKPDREYTVLILDDEFCFLKQ